MPRESRHVWVGNLPEKVQEEEVAEYFGRYGRVEKIKLLPKISPDGGRAAFVDFVDIRSATKANESNNQLGGRDLRTNYNEPGHKQNQNNQDFDRNNAMMHHRIHGGYPPPGLNYRQPPVVIYATPPVDHVTPPYRQMYQRDDRKSQNSYQSSRRERGRSPGSKGSLSEGDRSPSPKSRPRGGGNSSESDTSEKTDKCTVSVKNIIARGSDSSLEESLYHEFKKCGEIMNIIIKGTGQERYAYVQFSKAEEAEDATRSSGKVFLGQEMKVTIKGAVRPRSSTVVDDLAFDPHATRTIFVGNLDKGMMHGELRDIFERFGEVVDVDIKKMQTGITTYAFVQFIDINGATLAKRKMDRQAIGNNRIKVGYGRGTPTNSLWVGNLPNKVAEHDITKSLNQFGYIQRCLIDKKVWQALVRFETIDACTKAFAEMHGKSFSGKRLAVDYASPACRNAFYNRMERHGYLDRRQLEPSPTPPDAHVNFQNAARGGPFQPRGPGENKGDNRNDKYSDRFEKDRYRERVPGAGNVSPRKRPRESISPVRSERSDSRSKRKLSVGKSPDVEAAEPPKKKEKKKKKDKSKKNKVSKDTTATSDGGADGMQKSKAELKKERKEKKKAEKANKKAAKKEKKLKKLRDLEEKRMSIELQVKESSLEEQNAKQEEGIVKEMGDSELDQPSENDGISDVSQVTEDPPNTEVSEVSEGEAAVDSTATTTTTTTTTTGPKDEQKSEISQQQIIPADEKPADNTGEKPEEEAPPAAQEEGEKEEKEAALEKTDVQPAKQQQQDDSSDSSSSSSSSSESEDSDDSSDDERNNDAKKPAASTARQEKERPREPKAYRQDQDTERREYRERDREREYSRSKYTDYYRSPSGKDGQRTRSPSYRARSRSPYKRESSYDRRRGRSSSRGSPRYSRTDSSRSDKSHKEPPPPPPHKDGRKDTSSSYPPAISSSSGPSQSTDTLLDLLRRFPVMWQGLLGLKNDTAAVQMHFLSGNLHLAEQSLPRSAQPNEVPPPLRISQRMKLEPSQLEGVDKRIQQPKEHCMLLALPCGRDPLDVHAQTRALKTGFITYLQQKQAAGIINVPNPNDKQAVYVVHIFPPCEFAQSHLVRVAPDLLDSAVESGHLMVLITPL